MMILTSDEYKVLYLALLKDYEETFKLISMIEKSYAGSIQSGFEALSNDFATRLVYLNQHISDVSILLKKVYKLWKGGSSDEEKENGAKSR